MTHRQRNPRSNQSRRNPSQRHAVLEFLALTFLVVAVAFTAGMVVRKGHLSSGEAGQAVGLMRVDRAVAASAEPARLHQLAPAAGPREIAAPVAAVPTPAAEPTLMPVEVAAPAVVEPAPTPTAKVGPTFNGRPLKKAKTIRMLVTAYSPDERSCGASADGITASGYSVWTNGMKMVAADKKVLPFGAVITVPGYNGGQPVPVLDRGGAIKGKRLDVLYPTHEVAVQWGKQWLDVTVWEYAD